MAMARRASVTVSIAAEISGMFSRISRVRRVVEHELAIGEPSNQRDVMEARRVITDLALDLAEKGEIELNPEQEDELVFR